MKVLQAENPQYPTRMLRRLFVMPRSSLYRSAASAAAASASSTQTGSQETEQTKMLELAASWPRYGYRRLTAEMRRAGFSINGKKTRRMMQALGIKGHAPKRKVRTSQRNPCLPSFPNLVLHLQITQPNQVWVGDVTYIRLQIEFIYLAVIMDVFTRRIRGWHLGGSLEQALTLTALQKALLNHPPPQIHHSDQGVQYTSHLYTQLLVENYVQISMSEVGQAWQNGYAERLMRTIKEEEVDLQDYRDFDDALANLKTFIEVIKFLAEGIAREFIHKTFSTIEDAVEFLGIESSISQQCYELVVTDLRRMRG